MHCIWEIDVLASYPSIDTELLRTFVAIADHGGFTRAGEVVNRTQSAVSMQMKRLEDDIVQRSLFQRDGRTVSLTAEGQVLLGYARRILSCTAKCSIPCASRTWLARSRSARPMTT